MCTGVTACVQKSIHKKFPLLLTGGEGFGLPSAEELGVRGGVKSPYLRASTICGEPQKS